MLTAATERVSGLRRREFARLDRAHIAYLDYTGAALPPASLIRRDARRLLGSVWGNPHADSEPSLASTAAIERARARTLEFLHASPDDYGVIFTANASAAVRLVAEGFRFESASHLVLLADNHNSVNGLADPAWQSKATVTLAPLDQGLDAEPSSFLVRTDAASLFAYPAQSNFSGRRHPLNWVREAQARGYRVLLDAAALLGSAPLDLTDVPADFVPISFYKIFGYPTGIGALVARRDALADLRRRFFAGGTVDAVFMPHRIVQRKTSPEGFEDGTVSFLAMDAVSEGLEWMRGVGIDLIAHHVAEMRSRLLDVLREVGAIVYGATDDASQQGGSVAFNLPTGDDVVDYEVVEAAARAERVAIRGGCFCNPGAAAAAFGFDSLATATCLQRPFELQTFRRCMGGDAVGALRASVGIATSLDDLEALRRCLLGLRPA